ncbi:tetratricopeptide repeat protein [Clostridium sp. L74]|uniref:tetratricopeptide repeat protein n=1 Tax=Clostridium sp. L74 TaxID=1560217 RepID=UPI0006ABAE0D|nr:tetratricopeptide repeat protein [Clostridium sp. L74]KOR24141.1 hypothetical protein ND00_28470 [Clostridium sp. L74]
MNDSEIKELILNDKEYNNRKNKLNNIVAKKLLSPNLTIYEQKDLCIKALKLAKQVCNYSKEKGYNDYYVRNYGYDKNQNDLKAIESMIDRLDELCKNYEKDYEKRIKNLKLENEFNKYSLVFDEAREKEKAGYIDEALTTYTNILDNYIPEGSLYYERPAILLEKLKRYEEAIKVCDLAIKNQKENSLHFPKEDFEYRKNRLVRKLNKNCEATNKNKKQNITKDVTVVPQNNTLRNQENIKFPDWYISISFGKSTSKNFPQAVGLAKMAPQYIENEIEGKILYQAVYSHNPDEYLQFIKLYELVSKWKSCFIVINGQVVDRKIIGGLNYCYGDKCRSGNPDFCHGASYMTDNPFGCHRIQISRYNNPWWSFGIFDTSGIWHVDKEAILKRIIQYSQPYKLCPCFSLDKVKEALEKLPNSINPQTDENWERTGDNISPSIDTISTYSSITYEIKVNIAPNHTSKKMF